VTSRYRPKIHPVTDEAAEPRTLALFEAARSSLGFVPNTYRYMALAPALFETYRLGYGHIRQGSFTGVEQEVIFLTASLMNECKYCIAAHSALANQDYRMSDDLLDALRSGKALSDSKLQSLHALTRSLIETRGQPDEETVQSFLEAGYSEAQMFEVLLAVSLKMLSNFVGRFALPETDDRFAPFTP
jgi:uncharacterized peroxidase-related enzyme